MLGWCVDAGAYGAGSPFSHLRGSYGARRDTHTQSWPLRARKCGNSAQSSTSGGPKSGVNGTPNNGSTDVIALLQTGFLRAKVWQRRTKLHTLLLLEWSALLQSSLWLQLSAALSSTTSAQSLALLWLLTKHLFVKSKHQSSKLLLKTCLLYESNPISTHFWGSAHRISLFGI